MGLDDRGRPIIPGERKSNRVAIREASEEADDRSEPSDGVGSGIEVDDKSTESYNKSDGVELGEPNGVASLPRSEEVIAVD